MISEKRELGHTGIYVSRVGFGVLPMGPQQLDLSVDEGARLLCRGLKAGINFIDTAEYYHAYPYIRKALHDFESMAGAGSGTCPDSCGEGGGRPVICSKSLACDRAGMKKAVDDARTALDRDVIDIFLLHEVRSGQFTLRQGAWQYLADAKAKGLVRAIGLSTHHVDVTYEAASIPELDVVFPLLNYAGLGIRRGNRPATASEMVNAINKCRDAGKGVFTMKAFGGGALTASYQRALDYIFGQPSVQSVIIGFGQARDIDDIVNYMDGRMEPGYNPDISGKRFRIDQGDCEGCGACKAACPAGAIFYNERGLAEISRDLCLTCGYCSPVCPVRAIIMY